MPQFLLWMNIFNELAPLAVAAVKLVEDNAPATGAKGAQKFNAALSAVQTVVAAAPAAATEFTNTKAAIDAGNTQAVTSGIGHLIELALAVLKGLGAFQKAAIVQGAATLPGQDMSGPSGG